MTLREQDFDVKTWTETNDVEPPAYEKNERQPPSYRDSKQAQDSREGSGGGSGGECDSRIKNSLRKAFSLNKRFEPVTLGSVPNGSIQTGKFSLNLNFFVVEGSAGANVGCPCRISRVCLLMLPKMKLRLQLETSLRQKETKRKKKRKTWVILEAFITI